MRRGLSAPDAATAIGISVTLAREARDAWWDAGRDARRRPLVAASVGPYGAVLADGSEYRGDYGLTVDELVAFHEPRLRMLVDGQPDLLAIETIPSLDEARALVRVLGRVADAPPAWISFTCRDEAHIADGAAFRDAVALASDAPHVAGVGVNCTDPRVVEPLIATAAETAPAVVAYPNRGASWNAATRRWGGDGVDDLAALASRWRAAGARLIGGCCGTLPRDIRAVADVVTADATP
jgi:homocysteine S-methyltransferase